MCDRDYDGCIDDPCANGFCEDVDADQFDPQTGISHICINCTTGYEQVTEQLQSMQGCVGQYYRISHILYSINNNYYYCNSDLLTRSQPLGFASA